MPDTLLWNGDETWLTREFATQISTGHFRYPEARGATQSIGSGLIFNNMWITALVYGLPIDLVQQNGVIVGRWISVLLSVVLLYLLYRAGTEAGASFTIVLVALILLVCCGAFTYTSHSARYDMLTSVGVVAILIFCSWLVENASSIRPISQYALGVVTVATVLVSAHLVMCTFLILGYASVRVVKQQKGRALLRILAGAVLMLAFVLTLYAVTGNDDWTLTGPTSPLASALRSDSGYFPFRWWHGFHTFWADVSLLAIVLRGYALPIVLGYLIAIPLLFARGVRRINGLSVEATLIILVCLSYFFTELRDVRSLIYVLPVITLGLIRLNRILADQLGSSLFAIALAIPLLISVPYFVRHGVNGSRIGDRLVESSQTVYVGIAARLEGSLVPNARTLIDGHGMTYLLPDARLRPMADIFAWHPSQALRIEQTLEQNNVRYVIRLKAYGRRYDFFYRQDLDKYLDAHTAELERHVGFFSDYETSYNTGSKTGPDTIVVARLID